MKRNYIKKILAVFLAIFVTAIPSLSLGANEETVLYNLDFSDVENGSYSTQEIKGLTGETRITEDSSIPLTFTVSNGVAKINSTKSGANGALYMKGMFDTQVETGCIELVTNMVFADLSASGGTRQHLNLYSSAGKTVMLANAGRNCGTNLYAADTGGNALTFVNGTGAYNRGTERLNLKAYVYRTTTQQNWSVKMYDSDSEALILSTTLSSSDFPAITGIGGGYWRDGYANDVASCTLNISKQSAKLVPVSEVVKATATLPEESVIGTYSTLKVGFSAEMDPVTLSNITFTSPSGEDMVTSVVPSADGLSATVILESLVDNTAYTLTVPSSVMSTEGVGVTPVSKSITADADKNVLFNLDFTNVPDGTYTTEEIKTATGETRISERSGYSVSYIVNSGTCQITSAESYEGSMIVDMTLDDVVESGCIEFLLDIDIPETQTAANNIHMSVVSSNGNSRNFVVLERWNGKRIFSGGGSQSPGDQFMSGTSYYDNVKYAANLKIVIMREDPQSDWRVRMYDTDASNSVPILSTTLSAEEFPGIAGARSYYWRSTGSEYDAKKLVVRRYKISYAPIETLPYIESSRVENSAGTAVSTLVDKTIKSDGVATCKVDVNKTGGLICVAIYKSENTLVDIKGCVPYTMGEKTFTFNVKDPTPGMHMKVFYWDKNFAPITGYINPLVKR